MYHEDPVTERVVAYIENRHLGFYGDDNFLRNVVYDALREYRRLSMIERHKEANQKGYERT